jgi:hypothetical protein
MAAHSSQNASEVSPELPDVVPFDLQPLTRLSWELGLRIVEDDETTVLDEWEQTNTSWMLSVFRATSNTVIIRITTPVGRERFYGTTQADLHSALPSLAAAPYWEQLRG